MTIINMSDGRSFTDYRGAKAQIAEYKSVNNVHDSKSLRYSLITNAENVRNTHRCGKAEASGKAVLCGGEMAQYVSTKSTIKEFPKGPLHLTQ